ncbi:MAG: serine/threonine protein kinase [Planctomycetes bacterium]|nr:serine/threonine protein kinase [Planctomycetota bacterium]
MPLCCPRCRGIVEPTAGPGGAPLCPQCGSGIAPREATPASPSPAPPPAAAAAPLPPAPPPLSDYDAAGATVTPRAGSGDSPTAAPSGPAPDGVAPTLRMPAAAAVAGAARVGPYRIVREVGRGGMGIVYEAEDETLGRRVALKVLPPAYGLAAEVVERFKREASAAARLDHPNIARVLRVDEHFGTHYYVMDFIEGVPLHKLLAARGTAPIGEDDVSTQPPGTPFPHLRGPAYVREAARLLAEVAGALAEAHAQGIVHRDLKPSNLIYHPKGRLVLTDFGLVKMSDAAGLTATGEVIGTPAYMSPEQATGGAVDERTDVWSLGVTLYEMITGRCPFVQGNRHELLRAILAAEAIDPTAFNPHCSEALAAVILKALEKDAARRYASARELREDLERYLIGEAVRARPLPPLEKTVRRVLNLPLRYGYGACSMLAFVGALGLAVDHLAAAMTVLRWWPVEAVLQSLFFGSLTATVALLYVGIALAVYGVKVKGEAPVLALGGLVANLFLLVLANLLVFHYTIYGNRLMVKTEGYSLLAPEDVRAGATLAAKLRTQGEGLVSGNGAGPGRRVWELAGPELRARLVELARAQHLGAEERRALATGLNLLLCRREFYQPESWTGVELREAGQRLAARPAESLTEAEVRRRNRLLLEAGFPEEIEKSPDVPWGPFWGTLVESWGPRGGSRWAFAITVVTLALAWLAQVGRIDGRVGLGLIVGSTLILALKAADDVWVTTGRTVWEMEWTGRGVARAFSGYLALVMLNALLGGLAAAGFAELRPGIKRALVPSAVAFVIGLAVRVVAA